MFCVFVFVATQTRAKRNNWICEAKCIEIGMRGTGDRGRREPRESIVSWLLVDSWLGGTGERLSLERGEGTERAHGEEEGRRT